MTKKTKGPKSTAEAKVCLIQESGITTRDGVNHLTTSVYSQVIVEAEGKKCVIGIHIDLVNVVPTGVRAYDMGDLMGRSNRIDSESCDCGEYEVLFRELQEKLRKEAGATE